MVGTASLQQWLQLQVGVIVNLKGLTANEVGLVPAFFVFTPVDFYELKLTETKLLVNDSRRGDGHSTVRVTR